MVQISKATQLSWRRFLASDAGIEGMLAMREAAPNINKGQPHEICFDAGIATGYSLYADKLYSYIANPPKQEESAENL